MKRLSIGGGGGGRGRKGVGNLDRKIHVINWGTICLSKVKGGLGIRNLSMLNKALLGKWVWRFSVEENSTWRKVIRLKYQTEERGWFVKTPRGSYGVGMWKDISKEPRQLKQNCCFILGDGTKFDFGRTLGV